MDHQPLNPYRFLSPFASPVPFCLSSLLPLVVYYSQSTLLRTLLFRKYANHTISNINPTGTKMNDPMMKETTQCSKPESPTFCEMYAPRHMHRTTAKILPAQVTVRNSHVMWWIR